ncbi:hypothetical protein ABWH88_06820 [Marinobacter adhaerens]|uniref:hypothetical protein n=1 Tax=Marinobacter adhaerens TaxID=1033846 RepID=UPI0035D0BE03
MARKPSKTKQDQSTDQQPVDPEKVETSEAETQPEAAGGEQSEPESTTQPTAEPQSETAGPEEQEANPAARTRARMVEATLKTRHCRGGICKVAGETMSMTQGEYDRLKKYDRVE